MRIYLLAVLVILLVLILLIRSIGLSRREREKTAFFSVLCTAVGLYLFGYMLALLSPTLEAALIAVKVQNAGIPMFGPFALLFLLSAGGYRRLRLWMTWAAGGYALVFFLASLTNDFHRLYYAAVDFVPHGDYHRLALTYGPLYYLQQAGAAVCITIGCVVAIRYMMRWTPKGRRQFAPILIGILVAFAANALHVTLGDTYMDPTPVAIAVVTLVCLLSIQHHKLFDIVPLASASAIQTMADAIIVVDRDWCFRFCNRSAAKLFPALGELMGTESMQGVRGWPEKLMRYPGRNEFELEVEIDGYPRNFHVQIADVAEDKTRIGWCITLHDNTKSTELFRQMQELAATDYLTGIYNRRYFTEAAQRELEMTRREGLASSVVLFDLDHFKAINDTYGHDAGDQVLVATAEIVKSQLRKYDVFARYGGEEFIIFIVGADEADAESFAWRLCDSLHNAKLQYEGQVIEATASFGVVELPEINTLDEAMVAADKAMYRAKRKGRDRVEIGRIRRPRVRTEKPQ